MTKLTIETEWLTLDRGTAEDRATFGGLGIRLDDDLWLTEAEDAIAKTIRPRAFLSAYRLAEWAAWNWWRLRWEPFRAGADWAAAHSMSAIGGGYIWPNITFASDGERILLRSVPTQPSENEPLRYLCDQAAVVSGQELEGAFDEFITRVMERLAAGGLAKSNLSETWVALLEERSDPKLAAFRKLEALLGSDVGDASDDVISQLQEDASRLGTRAVEELAAAGKHARPISTAAELEAISAVSGVISDTRDAVRLQDRSRNALPTGGPAYRLGVSAARALRDQERLNGAPIANKALCEMLGIGHWETQQKSPFAFELDSAQTGHIVVRGNHPNGNRFDLARLLGDRVMSATSEPLRPATKSTTYRQKAQRAFAAEFLCPIDPLIEVLGGEYDADAVEEGANYFSVAEQVVRLQLINNRVVPRDDFDAYLAVN